MLEIVCEKCKEVVNEKWIKHKCAQESGTQSTDTQQLKAEIAKVADSLEEHCKSRSYVLLDKFISELRQLSAV